MVQDSVVKSVITATSTKTIYDLKYTKSVKAFQALMLGKGINLTQKFYLGTDSYPNSVVLFR